MVQTDHKPSSGFCGLEFTPRKWYCQTIMSVLVSVDQICTPKIVSSDHNDHFGICVLELRCRNGFFIPCVKTISEVHFMVQTDHKTSFGLCGLEFTLQKWYCQTMMSVFVSVD